MTIFVAKMTKMVKMAKMAILEWLNMATIMVVIGFYGKSRKNIDHLRRRY